MIKRKILLVCIGIMGGLFLGEVLLRVFSFVKISNRNNEISHIRKDYFTILCIGDSVTYGVGGIEGRGYPKKLEEILTKKGYKIKVINKAYPGASTAGVLRQLKNSLCKYKIDLVIILTGCGNSLWNLNEMYEDLIKLPLSFRDKIFLKVENFFMYFKIYKFIKLFLVDKKYKSIKCPFLYKKCLEEAMNLRNKAAFYDICENKFFDNIIDTYKKCLLLCPEDKEPYLRILEMYTICKKPLPKDIKKAILKNPFTRALIIKSKGKSLDTFIKMQMERHILKIIKLCKDRNINLIFLNYPSGDSVIDIRKFAKSFIFIDLENYFKIKLKCNRCKELFSDNIHLNSWGYYLMAKKIADVIEEAFLKNKYIYKGLKNDKVHNKI